MISEWRLTICSIGRYLSSALCQHRGSLDTRSQYHGWSLGHYFLFLLAKNAGEHLPLGRRGPSLGPDGDTQLLVLHGTARGMTQTRISHLVQILILINTTNDFLKGSPHLSVVVTVSPCVPLSGMLSYSILLDSMKFFCIADIWAIIFCRWSLAASAFLLRSAFSLSWALCNNNTSGGKLLNTEKTQYN